MEQGEGEKRERRARLHTLLLACLQRTQSSEEWEEDSEGEGDPSRVVAFHKEKLLHFLKYPGCLSKYKDDNLVLMRARLRWEAWSIQLDDRSFRKFYRMTRTAFDNLVDALHPALSQSAADAGSWNSLSQSHCSSTAGLITSNLKVSMTLRWLAGGSYIDITHHHRVSETSFWRHRDAVLEAINSSVSPTLGIAFPALDDEEALRAIAQGFAAKSENWVFLDVVGAIDSMLVELAYVRKTDSQQPGKYFTRNGTYALNLQAVCDADQQFRHFSLRCCGPTHDSIAYMHTELWADLEEQGMIQPFFFVGD
jgi:hypothetical protein